MDNKINLTQQPNAGFNTKPQIIPLRPPSDAPKRGLHQGRFSDYRVLPSEDASSDAIILQLSIELDSTDKTGKPFVVDKQYKLRGRGLTALLGDLNDCDLKSADGSAISFEQMESLDPSTFLNHRITVEIQHSGPARKPKVSIKSFAPAVEGADLELKAA